MGGKRRLFRKPETVKFVIDQSSYRIAEHQMLTVAEIFVVRDEDLKYAAHKVIVVNIAVIHPTQAVVKGFIFNFRYIIAAEAGHQQIDVAVVVIVDDGKALSPPVHKIHPFLSVFLDDIDAVIIVVVCFETLVKAVKESEYLRC